MKCLLLIILSLLTLNFYGQSSSKHKHNHALEIICRCDSALTFNMEKEVNHPTYVFIMNWHLVTNDYAIKRIKSFKPSKIEFRNYERLSYGASVAGFSIPISMLVTGIVYGAYNTPVPAIIFIPLSIAATIILRRLEEKHFKNSINLYNQEMCNRLKNYLLYY